MILLGFRDLSRCKYEGFLKNLGEKGGKGGNSNDFWGLRNGVCKCGSEIGGGGSSGLA